MRGRAGVAGDAVGDGVGDGAGDGPGGAAGAGPEIQGDAPSGRYPGDTHWYDLPDDDAAPEEGEHAAGARWLRWRSGSRR
ncbi:hypothetical protein [Microbispora amethystogenes]|uniref:Uncharacterized protein n=1 Tax=Microbispora amethystogenes TaxID=1427754 RepID=A0ABQ4FPF0_9ACTN|nr:hypothetical protein [Microbispora amethystogenes]GIH36669.1 hypothetical protein Mam01_68330 [Microbispora amethystogenes]